MRIQSALVVFISLLCLSVEAQTLETKPSDPYFAKFLPLKSPKAKGSVLKPNDRLAICGDSITEQKMYSRIIETYLTVALPDWNVSTRQYGWGGEQTSGFLARMTNDVLRFKPTIATTCYGMNDHHYQPYEPEIGRAYGSNTTDIILAFKDAGTRVVLGSSGSMGQRIAFKGTPEDRNLSLCMLRNIDIEIAKSEHVGFADVFWPMFQAEYFARQKYGSDYALAGRDSVHPDWAGHLVMAYAFLKALNVPGEIGTFTVDLSSKKAKVSTGHKLVSWQNGELTVTSSRYPFCAAGPVNVHNTIRSGMSLVPFNQELNRLILIAKNGKAKNYKVTWGGDSKIYSAQQLSTGVNLADDFPVNPFSDAFAKVDDAVAAKQAFETTQVKKMFHGAEGKADMKKTVTESEQERKPLVAAIKAAMVSVTHTIVITPQ